MTKGTQKRPQYFQTTPISQWSISDYLDFQARNSASRRTAQTPALLASLKTQLVAMKNKRNLAKGTKDKIVFMLTQVSMILAYFTVDSYGAFLL